MRYDSLREQLGKALITLSMSRQGACDPDEVRVALLDACEELNKIEFGGDSIITATQTSGNYSLVETTSSS